MTAPAAQRSRLTADPLRGLLALIAAVTALTGLSQLVAPGVALGLLDAESTATSRQLFATVGMFMVVVGGVTLHALLTEPAPAFVIGWAALQKAGAAVAVTWGVAADVFGELALLVAAFDALTAVLALVLWQRLRA